MKKFGPAMVLGLALLAPLAMADPGNQNGCGPSDGRPKKCDDSKAVPEPGVVILVGLGLLALGGFALVRRKQESN
jgi:hypothetical protein